jgi:hypothetical protein
MDGMDHDLHDDDWSDDERGLEGLLRRPSHPPPRHSVGFVGLSPAATSGNMPALIRLPFTPPIFKLVLPEWFLKLVDFEVAV